MSPQLFAEIIPTPNPAEKYAPVINDNGLKCPTNIAFEDLIEDTIRLVYNETADLSTPFYAINYVTPDTVWVKPGKKNPKEGKHYHLLHYLGAFYYENERGMVLNDFNRIENTTSASFRINEYKDRKFYATEISSQKQVVINLEEFSGFLLRSNRITRYYNSLLHKHYYTFFKGKSGSKVYTKREINQFVPYINFNGEVLFSTDISLSYSFAQYEQYRLDSIAKAKFEEEYNTPRQVDYVVRKQKIEFDEEKFGEITGFKTDSSRMVVIKTKSSAYIGQNILHGKLEHAELLSSDEPMLFLGIDSVCNEEYYIVGKEGKIFYIKPSDVDLDWEWKNKYENSPKIKAYRKASPEIQRDFFEYAKSIVYKIYKLNYEDALERNKVIKSKGIFFKELRLTEGYSSTGLDVSLVNLSKKVIKYLSLTTKAYNAVDDFIETKSVQGIGPINPGDEGYYEFDHLWWTTLVEYHKPISATITYMDGSTVKLNAKDIDNCWDDDSFKQEREDLEALPNLKTGILNTTTNQVEPYPTISFSF